MYENIYEGIEKKFEIDAKRIQDAIKNFSNAMHKIAQLFIKTFQSFAGIENTVKNYKNNFFNEKQIKTYGLIQPNADELLKAKKLYNKLKNKGEISFDFFSFYTIWGVEIQKLNINKIDCLDKLVAKVHGYKKYRRKLILSGKVKKCINCCWRMGGKKHIGSCAAKPVLDDKGEFDYYTSVHDEYRCDLWHSRYPEYDAKEFITRVFNDLNDLNDLTSEEEEDGNIEI
jgi:hypothetical protein